MGKYTNLYLSDETKRKALEIAEAMSLLDQRKHPSMSQAVTAAIEALYEQVNRDADNNQERNEQ